MSSPKRPRRRGAPWKAWALPRQPLPPCCRPISTGSANTASPVLPLIGGGETKFQPVYVCDVAEAAARAVDGGLKAGTVYELGGPEVKSFKDCLEEMLEITRRSRPLVPVPFAIASALGKVLQLVPGAPLTADQVELLKSDNVVSEAAKAEGRTLEGLGIAPATLAAVLPTYLDRFREHGQYDAHRPA